MASMRSAQWPCTRLPLRVTATLQSPVTGDANPGMVSIVHSAISALHFGTALSFITPAE